MVHCVFQAMGRADLRGDEQLVDVLATFLHQYETSREGDLWPEDGE
jgi:hypothetical protein